MSQIQDDTNRTRRLEKTRVLIVEDHPFVAWKLSSDLSARGATVYSPRFDAMSVEALDDSHGLYRKTDVAILDLNLGDHTSLRIANQLRKAGVPVVFYTGEPDVPPELSAEYSGSIIRKPAHPDAIVGIIQRALALRKDRAVA